MSISYKSIQATAKQIEAAGVTVNGVIVDATALSVLARYKVVTVAGLAVKSPHQKGKASSIYLLNGRPDFIVEFTTDAVERVKAEESKPKPVPKPKAEVKPEPAPKPVIEPEPVVTETVILSSVSKD